MYSAPVDARAEGLGSEKFKGALRCRPSGERDREAATLA
jgi:hypothetical protein